MSRATAEHVRQIGRAVFVLRRADGDEDDARGAHGTREIGRELEALLRPVAPDHLLEAGLVDGHDAAPKPPDLRRILVDARDVVAVFRQTGSQHQADVACSDDRNFHS